ncbi:MAG: phosphatase PAP2 family protein, partial [Bacteroidia bacterium]|nr:phosphatase PAP2 family protein [Bacteroidia bacterium]
MGIIESIKQLDTELFLYLNSKHTAFFDVVMYWASHKLFWIPLYSFFLYLAYKYFGKKVWIVALTATIAIVLSDQISTQLFKNVFLRYRPCHNLLIQSQIHLNGNCGGTYGFVSSHAANTFALATLLFLLFKNKIKYFGIVIFSWASFVSYSRIYNGVHYPADISVGALLGIVV